MSCGSVGKWRVCHSRVCVALIRDFQHAELRALCAARPRHAPRYTTQVRQRSVMQRNTHRMPEKTNPHPPATPRRATATQTPPASQHSQCIQFHACHTQVKEWKSSVDLSCCLGIVIDVGCDTGYCSTAHQSKFCFLFHCYVSYAWHHVILGENLKHVLVVGKWSDPKEAKQNLAQFRDVFEDIYLEPKKEPSYLMI